MTGREYLNEYLSLGHSLDYIQNDILLAREQASKVTPSYSAIKVQSSHEADRIGTAITTAVLQEERLVELLGDQAHRTKVILDVMRPMDYAEQSLLMALYLNGHTIHEYAEKIERCEKQVYRMKKMALNHFDELFVDSSAERKTGEAV